MAAFSEDFLRFLYANYPDDYRRASTGDVSEGVVNAIMLKHEYHYQVWKNVPEWIKNRYGDRLPRDVLNGNETAQDFVLKETGKKEKEQEYTEEVIGFSVTMLALGYTAETASALMENRALRESLLRDAIGGELTEEQMRQWLESRGKDIIAITEDWKKNQPEKYLVHVAKALSREKLRCERAGNDADKAASEMKISALERELASVMQNLNTREQKMCMVDYLRQKPQQAALRHLRPDVLSEFMVQMKKKGIAIEPVDASLKKEYDMFNFNNLTEGLKRDFARMKKQGTIFNDAFKRGESDFKRASVGAILDGRNNGGVAKIVPLKQRAHSKQKVRA